MFLLLLVSCATDQAPVLKGESIGSCSYTSPFSGTKECREYYNTDADYAEADCKDLETTFGAGELCEVEEILGYCIFEDDGVQVRAAVEGDDPSSCGSNRFGCETFARGYWQPAANCDGNDEIVVLNNPWPQPEKVCMDAIEGEPPGLSEDGEVCTWQLVSGATEEGRNFSDYASCDIVRRQRPYGPSPGNARADEPDARMDDPTYVAELDWVRDQVSAASCDCCHSAVAPQGAAVFDTDFAGNMANQFNDRGIAMAAGWIPTIGFGTFPPEENNGFVRSSPENPNLSIIPSTDPQRMIAFFEAEAAMRGLKKADFAGDTYGAGPLDEQRLYRPEECSAEEGVGLDGVLSWLPGRARYIYVLEADSASPTVPPNLDLPEGTLWRVDLPPDGAPVRSGSVVYGEVPEGMFQVYPESGEAPALEVGKEYYLYVMADILYPISRCTFTFGEEPQAEGCNSAVGGGTGLLGVVVGLAAINRRRRR